VNLLAIISPFKIDCLMLLYKCKMKSVMNKIVTRRVWRYQRGNQTVYRRTDKNKGKTKGQKDKQRSIAHTYKTKDRVTRTPLKIGGELMCSGRVGSSCSTSGTRRVNLVTNTVISREWGKNRELFTTSGTYPWSFVTQIFHSGQPSQLYQ
jgi:hypothetical protein